YLPAVGRPANDGCQARRREARSGSIDSARKVVLRNSGANESKSGQSDGLHDVQISIAGKNKGPTGQEAAAVPHILNACFDEDDVAGAENDVLRAEIQWLIGPRAQADARDAAAARAAVAGASRATEVTSRFQGFVGVHQAGHVLIAREH